jgi:hypothetical protein
MYISLNGSQWFLVGAFTILFFYFITYYIARRDEKYNLYFSLGCIVTIIRTLTMGFGHNLEPDTQIYYNIHKISNITFIWGPFIYILLADSLFSEINKKK